MPRALSLSVLLTWAVLPCRCQFILFWRIHERVVEPLSATVQCLLHPAWAFASASMGEGPSPPHATHNGLRLAIALPTITLPCTGGPLLPCPSCPIISPVTQSANPLDPNRLVQAPSHHSRPLPSALTGFLLTHVPNCSPKHLSRRRRPFNYENFDTLWTDLPVSPCQTTPDHALVPPTSCTNHNTACLSRACSPSRTT